MYYRTIELVKRHIRDNLFIYSVVFLCFLVGISVGTFTVKIVDKHQKEDLFYYLKDFFQLFYNSELNNSSVFRQSFMNNFQLLLLNWVLGTFVITAPLVLIVILFKGFVIGFTTGLLFEEFKLWGILIFVFGIFPQNIIIVPAFILSAVIALTFANSFLKQKIQKSKGMSFSKKYLSFSLLFGLIIIFISFASIIEAYIAPIFIRLFIGNIL